MILAIQETCEIRFYLVGNPYVAEKTMTLRNRAPRALQNSLPQISAALATIRWFWANYSNSLTWNKAILGMIPLTNYDFQWGRSEVVIIYPGWWYPCTNHDPPSRSWDQSSTSFFTLSGLPLAFQFPPPDETGATLKKGDVHQVAMLTGVTWKVDKSFQLFLNDMFMYYIIYI